MNHSVTSPWAYFEAKLVRFGALMRLTLSRFANGLLTNLLSSQSIVADGECLVKALDGPQCGSWWTPC
jgi:hypothetical protein